jgi:hypothetical protein
MVDRSALKIHAIEAAPSFFKSGSVLTLVPVKPVVASAVVRVVNPFDWSVGVAIYYPLVVYMSIFIRKWKTVQTGSGAQTDTTELLIT